MVVVLDLVNALNAMEREKNRRINRPDSSLPEVWRYLINLQDLL